jgi:hypothetical protein
MTQLTTITIGSRRLEIHRFSGQVTSAEKWSTTEVSGGGGSGVISNGSGYVSNNPVKSKTTNHAQLLVLAPDGEERSLKLENVELAIRPGHWVSLIYAIRSGKQNGPYVAIFNHNTASLDFIPDGADKACIPFGSSLIGGAAFLVGFFGGLIAVIAGHYVLALLLAAPCVAYFVWLGRRRRAFRDQVGALTDELKMRDGAPRVTMAAVE